MGGPRVPPGGGGYGSPKADHRGSLDGGMPPVPVAGRDAPGIRRVRAGRRGRRYILARARDGAAPPGAGRSATDHHPVFALRAAARLVAQRDRARLRRAALQEAGGVATSSSSELFSTALVIAPAS